MRMLVCEAGSLHGRTLSEGEGPAPSFHCEKQDVLLA